MNGLRKAINYITEEKIELDKRHRLHRNILPVLSHMPSLARSRGRLCAGHTSGRFRVLEYARDSAGAAERSTAFLNHQGASSQSEFLKLPFTPSNNFSWL